MVEFNDNVMRISLVRQVDDSYNVVFGSGLFPKIARDLKEKPLGSKYAIVTDSKVGNLYAGSLEGALRREGLSFQTFSFEAGEPNKTNENCIAVVDGMNEQRYGRDSAIIALGGGVVGDMAGFIAAIFLRGVPYIQIPTTMVAQADSSIGGKTAVDTRHGKNLLGAFKHPTRVYIDVETIRTLSEREYGIGLAETIKHGIIQDAEFFNYLRDNLDGIVARSSDTLLHLAMNNCRIKGNVVEIDPNEKGLRMILNYGHTIGHALEKLSLDKYQRGKIEQYFSHGEVVSMGMMVAARIAIRTGSFSLDELAQQEELLQVVKLPTKIPDGYQNDDILSIAASDKKARDGKIRFVLPKSIGAMNDFGGKYATHVEHEIVLEALNATR